MERVPVFELQLLASPRLRSASVLQEVPLELRLRRVSFSLLKTTRRWLIRATRIAYRSVNSWTNWAVTSLILLAVGALASAIDLRLLRLWRERGRRVAYLYALIGMAVFFRLLREPRAPGWPRVAILAALAYGIFPGDLLTDRVLVLGWLDDAALIGLVARWFVRRCPDAIVEEHAAYVRERSARVLSSAP